jgi:hypothetical protein
LWHRLPRVARVFVSGVIDYRLVSTIVARTQNVDEAVMPALDEAIARHCAKWMKLSVAKLRDRVDVWVSKFDPAAVRVAPKVDDNRHVEIVAVAPGVAVINGVLRAEDGAGLNARLDAVAATVCAHDPRTHAQRRSDAAGAVGRWEPPWSANADVMIARPVPSGRRPAPQRRW